MPVIWFQPRSNPNYNRRHVDKPTSPPEYKRSTDINRNEYGEVHRAEPVSNSQRIYPDPLYATRQDSAVITSASTDSQHLHPSDNIQSYDRSPKQTKRKPSPRYPNTNTSTEPHGHNNQSKDYSDPYDAINNLDSLEAGFSVISPVHSSSETRTLSPGSPRSSQVGQKACSYNLPGHSLSLCMDAHFYISFVRLYIASVFIFRIPERIVKFYNLRKVYYRLSPNMRTSQMHSVRDCQCRLVWTTMKSQDHRQINTASHIETVTQAMTRHKKTIHQYKMVTA